MKIQGTRVYDEIDKALRNGYTTISEQGSSRSSKTYNTIIWLCVYCYTHPNTTASVVRATLPALKGSVLRDFENVMRGMGVWNDRGFNKSELIYKFGNGSWVEFFSCDNEQKLRGRKRQILFVNEGNELKFIEWQQLQMRTTQFSIIDYNPSFSDDHWLCALNKEPKTYHFITTYRDNPFLEQKVVDEIESLKQKNPSLWRIYGEGLQAQVEGLIFSNIETVDDFPLEIKHLWAGIDFGYSNDPTAIVIVGAMGDGLYIKEVAYYTEMLSSDIISVLKQKCARMKVISESADPRLIQEIYRAGIDIHPVQKFGGSIEAGITKMLEMKIHVTKDSLNVLKEFHNYTYRQDKEGKWLNQPIDAWNHAIDAVRYVVMTEIMGGRAKPVDLSRIASRLGR